MPPYDPQESTNVRHLSTARQQVESFVASRINFERLSSDRYDLQDFKLDRMQALLAELGSPQHSLPAIHIAGTKGKGSTAAMTAAILQAAGSRVGLFTSPHLDTLGERMTVNGLIPGDETLLEVLDVVRPVVLQLDRQGTAMQATFFEVLTAMAWVHFRQARVDFVVLEVGLGGRLDATNVCHPLVSIITSISHDHERLLGHELTQIAAEKAGIIRPHVPVLSGVLDVAPREVIHRVCKEQQAPLYELVSEIRYKDASTENSAVKNNQLLKGSTVSITTPWRTHERLTIPLAGRHQQANAALAVAAAELLSDRGIWTPANAVREGLASVVWPLRIEVLAEHPLVLVDVAHNDGSVDALIEVIKPLDVAQRWLIFGTSKDKNADAMLGRLARHSDHVILTRYVDNPRAMPLLDLEQIAARVVSGPWETSDDPQTAWNRVSTRAQPGDLICVAGSVFLAAEMRRIIQKCGTARDTTTTALPNVVSTATGDLQSHSSLPAEDGRS